jgi:hypothetical protein
MNIDLAALQGRKLIGYGAGLATLLTLRETPLDLEFIVDDNPKSQGTDLFGIPIVSPAALERVELRDYSVVIFAYTGSAIRAIQDRLASLGLGFPENWIDCSLLHFQSYRRRLQKELRIDASPRLFSVVRAASIYTYPQNLSGFAGTWLYLELINHLNLRHVQGTVAEIGVFEGGNAFCSLLSGTDIMMQRILRLFDSFSGFSDMSVHDPVQRKAEFADVTVTKVRNCLSSFENVRIHPGFVANTLGEVRDEEFAFVYYDADLYEPAMECCSFFYEKLPRGGMMLFHDYCGEEPELPRGARVPFSGVKKAVDEFFAGRGERLVHFPETTHVLAIKE